MARAFLIVFAIAALARCTKHDERYITPWLRVDVRRPSTGTSGLIRVGSAEQKWDVQVNGHWQTLGTGPVSSYLMLGEEAMTSGAVLVDLNDQNGLQLVRPDAPPLPLRSILRRPGTIYWPAPAMFDVLACDGGNACVDRYDLMSGRFLTTTDVSIPKEYSDCQHPTIAGYVDKTPYVSFQCSFGSPQAQCVLAAQRKDGPFVYAVGRDAPPSECGTFQHAGVKLRNPSPQFTIVQ